MKTWTVHLRPETAPVLVPESFSWGAAIFGPLWLFAYRAWIAGVLALCAGVALGVGIPDPALRGALLLGLAWVLGLWGQDLRRWSLSRRGFSFAHVVAARNADAAHHRLAEQFPELHRMGWT